MERDVGALYVAWKGVFAVFHRGYWLVASLYLVLDADLSPFQLVAIGVVQGLVALVSEVPAGVVADTLSRKWSLIVAHGLMGAAIVATGVVTAFPALAATQALWGLAWTFVSGADVAWVTDELRDRSRIDRVLAGAARGEAAGSAIGLVVFGALAWATDRGSSIVVTGVAVLALGVAVAVAFPERHFVRATERRWATAATVLRMGTRLARRDREILLVLAATFLVNGAAEVFGRLYAKRLVALGWPRRPDPIVWYTALGVAMLLAGALVLRVVQARIDGTGAARRHYVAASACGAVGLLVLALAPDSATAAVGVLLAGGVSFTVIRVVGTIWVNRRATDDVRATVLSFLAQAEYLGEIVVGLSFGLLARATTISTALGGAAVVMLATSAIVFGHRTGTELPVRRSSSGRAPIR